MMTSAGCACVLLQVEIYSTRWLAAAHRRCDLNAVHYCILCGAHNKEMIRDECGNYYSAYNGAIIRWCWLGERDMNGPLEIAFFYVQAIRCEHFSGFSLSDFSSFVVRTVYYVLSKVDGKWWWHRKLTWPGVRHRCRSFEGWITPPNSSSHPINCCWASYYCIINAI